MLLGLCFIGLGIALLLGGLALMRSATSTGTEILAAVVCLAAWGLAVWGIVRFRIAAIGREFGRLRAAHEAKDKQKPGAKDPEASLKTTAPDSDRLPPTRLP